MTKRVKQKIYSAYIIVLILGAILAGLVYLKNDNVLRTSDEIVSQNLPNLHSLFSLKDLTNQQKAIVYNFYASGNRKQFREDYNENKMLINEQLQAFKRHTSYKAYITAIEHIFHTIDFLIAQLDNGLSARRDSGEIIALLTEITNQYQSIPRRIDRMIRLEQAAANQSGQNTVTAISQVKLVVAGLSIAIFFISLFIGYYLYNYLKDQAERRNLAMFPERSPNPVLRLTKEGKLEYANPTAWSLLKKIDSNLRDPLSLLPETLLKQIRASDSPTEFNTPIDYQIGAFILECDIHYLPDLENFHIYITDVTDRKKAEQNLTHQAYHDALTSLPNRLKFISDIQSRILISKEKDTRSAVILLWLDRFDVVTGSLGHGIGDNLLQTISLRLKSAIQMYEDLESNISLYRFEGVVFSILVPSYTHKNTPNNIAQHIVDAMNYPVYTDNREFFLSFSIGISVYPDDGDDVTTLLRNAESAMQFSKQQGGNTFHCYTSEMNARAEERLTLENNLRYALSKNELELFYQPQINLATNAIIGCEALLRWQHPQRGTIPPSQFIPIAEETGLITPIGEWILLEACHQAMRWINEGVKPIVIAVNISPRQFHHPSFLEQIKFVLNETHIEPGLLELEITESIAMDNIDKTVHTLHNLKDLGIRLSIDDFGTGFSSMSYLKNFPIDKLKIDQSFIEHIASNNNDAAITSAIIDVGKKLKLDVIAEGVETQKQLRIIRKQQCDYAQGYLFYKPEPAGQLLGLLRKRDEMHTA